MNDKKEKEINNAEAAEKPTSGPQETGFTFNGKPMYFDDDRLYYIDDDGNREYKIKLADLDDEQREEMAGLVFAPLIELFASKKDSLSKDEFIEMITQGLLDKLYASQDLINELQDLEQFINAAAKKDGGAGLTYSEIMGYTAGELLDMLEDPNSKFYKTMEAARIARANTETTAAKRADKIEFPLDKPNSRIWNLLNEGSEQLQFDLLPKKAQLEARAMFAINFDELNDVKITRRLQPFDKRVYMAISALFNAGNDIVSLSQIYYAMGYTGTPGTSDRNKINDSITKMSGAKILLDNAKEAEALNNIMHFQYDGSLLPIERRSAIINGKLSDAAIKIFREPPLMTFAKQRKQVTTIDVQLLQSPLSKTDANIQIDDYLIERISKAKNGKSHVCTVLLKTLYERTNITTKKQRQRAAGKIETLLTHYQQQEFIKKYTLDSEKITIHF